MTEPGRTGTERSLARWIASGDTASVRNCYRCPGMAGLCSSGLGVLLCLGAWAADTQLLGVPGVVLLLVGGFLGFGQLLKYPRSRWTYPMLAGCLAPLGVLFYLVSLAAPNAN